MTSSISNPTFLDRLFSTDRSYTLLVQRFALGAGALSVDGVIAERLRTGATAVFHPGKA
jgi:hypothetical protein